jgi:hypothetical protein
VLLAPTLLGLPIYLEGDDMSHVLYCPECRSMCFVADDSMQKAKLNSIKCISCKEKMDYLLDTESETDDRRKIKTMEGIDLFSTAEYLSAVEEITQDIAVLSAAILSHLPTDIYFNAQKYWLDRLYELAGLGSSTTLDHISTTITAIEMRQVEEEY